MNQKATESRTRRFIILSFCLVWACSALTAQQRGWGVEASGSYLTLPRSILENVVENQYTKTISLEGYTLSGRLCRIKDNGAPSYSFGYVQTRLSLRGTAPMNYATLNGYAVLRGAIITKYFNFVERRRGSFGLLLGGGIARVNAGSMETFTPPNRPPYYETDQWRDKPLPLLEFGLQGDVRVSNRFSVFFLGGFQHVALGGGAGIRYRFR